MTWKMLLSVIFALCLCMSGAYADDDEDEWNYSGREGPEHWAELDEHNLPCASGSQQSPVDISETIEADLPSLQVRWRNSRGTMVNNGHTIQVNLDGGGALHRGKEDFRLLQFHFHAPSEHHVDGRAFPIEAHFVHKDDRTGILGVLSVFFVPGAPNKTFSDLASNFPAQRGEEAQIKDILPVELLPNTLEYWLYEGSLTTPPCSENVEWMIATEPVEVDAADIAKFAALYSRNARPIHSHNRRFILRGD